jgi:hypothetical protein
MQPVYFVPQYFSSVPIHFNPLLHLISPLALQPNSGLGRLHETFRFTSVTRCRTVSRTPWTGDQLVARPLPVHKQRNAHNINTKHPCPECDSNPHPGVRASEDSSCHRPAMTNGGPRAGCGPRLDLLRPPPSHRFIFSKS